jgi:hypothetical protein
MLPVELLCTVLALRWGYQRLAQPAIQSELPLYESVSKLCIAFGTMFFIMIIAAVIWVQSTQPQSNLISVVIGFERFGSLGVLVVMLFSFVDARAVVLSLDNLSSLAKAGRLNP